MRCIFITSVAQEAWTVRRTVISIGKIITFHTSFVRMRAHVHIWRKPLRGRVDFQNSRGFCLPGSTSPMGGYCQVSLGNKPRKDTPVNKPQALHAIPTKGCVYSWWRMACSPGGYTQRDDPLCEIKLIETCGVALLGRRAQLGEDHCGWTQMGDALPSSDTCS